MKTDLGNSKNSDSRDESASNAEYHLLPREVGRLIAAAGSPRNSALIQLLAETGLRRSEAIDLKIADVRWHSGEVVVRSGKGGKTRLVPLTTSMTNSLRGIADHRTAGYLFISQKGSRLSERQANRILTQAGQRANLANPNPLRRNITCHLLRHSFARTWKDQRGDIEALSRILGHASVKTTWDLYGRLSQNDIARTYRRTMERILLANSQGEVSSNPKRRGK
jgi:integrase